MTRQVSKQAGRCGPTADRVNERMFAMCDEPRLRIKPTKDEPRCHDLHDVSWPTTPAIFLPSGAVAVISVFLPLVVSFSEDRS